ncbi:MAG: hypothetical protein JWQ07_1472 [Ramlibacter sp.]|nr:hypothetical protein [Ramlibacter sp.]
MGLLKNLFGGAGRVDPPAGTSSQFHETESTIGQLGSANAPRREMVMVVLRDTMRKHGIPSDWIDCRILSVLTRKRRSGMHVQFVVLKGEEQLLDYVHAFQDSFWLELAKYETRPRDWLFSVGWQFEGNSRTDINAMPSFDGWDGDTLPPEEDRLPQDMAQDTRPPEDGQPSEGHEEDLEEDLKQLFAIRDAALHRPAEGADLPSEAEEPRERGPGRS